uniref:Birch protein n=1 Tax=Betula platyphylla TaxID=78630 RepID=A0A9E9L874_BETPL|nr:birch protein [Betula platyphylla]
MKIWLSVFALLVVSKIFQVDVHGVAPPQPQVPCYFIFGDSLADNGNNNLLPTEARANYPPYGIDYPHGLTGRFTNGRTTVDIIAELLGFDKHIPPFTTANGSDILQGGEYHLGQQAFAMKLGATGFKIWDVGCCQAGENGQCIPKQNTICKERNEYLFWDSFHPTEAVNKMTAMRSYSTADEYDAYPMDIKSLAKL